MVTRALLIGFGPFPGVANNPSAELVRTLEHRNRLPAVSVSSAVLPTTYEAVARELPELLERNQADVVLLFGLATRARVVRIESRAVRAASLLHPDAAGAKPPEGLFGNGPASLAVRAPVQRLVAAARDAGVHARVSRDAGRYLCNAALYVCLDSARQSEHPRRVAFMHIPYPRTALSEESKRDAVRPSFAQLVRAGMFVLRALANDAKHG